MAAGMWLHSASYKPHLACTIIQPSYRDQDQADLVPQGLRGIERAEHLSAAFRDTPDRLSAKPLKRLADSV